MNGDYKFELGDTHGKINRLHVLEDFWLGQGEVYIRLPNGQIKKCNKVGFPRVLEQDTEPTPEQFLYAGETVLVRTSSGDAFLYHFDGTNVTLVSGSTSGSPGGGGGVSGYPDFGDYNPNIYAQILRFTDENGAALSTLVLDENNQKLIAGVTRKAYPKYAMLYILNPSTFTPEAKFVVSKDNTPVYVYGGICDKANNCFYFAGRYGDSDEGVLFKLGADYQLVASKVLPASSTPGGSAWKVLEQDEQYIYVGRLSYSSKPASSDILIINKNTLEVSQAYKANDKNITSLRRLDDTKMALFCWYSDTSVFAVVDIANFNNVIYSAGFNAGSINHALGDFVVLPDGSLIYVCKDGDSQNSLVKLDNSFNFIKRVIIDLSSIGNYFRIAKMAINTDDQKIYLIGSYHTQSDNYCILYLVFDFNLDLQQAKELSKNGGDLWISTLSSRPPNTAGFMYIGCSDSITHLAVRMNYTIPNGEFASSPSGYTLRDLSEVITTIGEQPQFITVPLDTHTPTLSDISLTQSEGTFQTTLYTIGV